MQASEEKLSSQSVDHQKLVLESLQILKECQSRFAPYEGCLILDDPEDPKLNHIFVSISEYLEVVDDLKKLKELTPAQKDVMTAAYQLISQFYFTMSQNNEGDEDLMESDRQVAIDAVLAHIKLIASVPATQELQKLRINLAYGYCNQGEFDKAIEQVSAITNEIESKASSASKRALEVYGEEVCFEAYFVKALAFAYLEDASKAYGIREDQIESYFHDDKEKYQRFLGMVGQKLCHLGKKDEHAFGVAMLADFVRQEETEKLLVQVSHKFITALPHSHFQNLTFSGYWESLEKACQYYRDSDQAPLAYAYLLLANFFVGENNKKKVTEFFNKAVSLQCQFPSYSADVLSKIREFALQQSELDELKRESKSDESSLSDESDESDVTMVDPQPLKSGIGEKRGREKPKGETIFFGNPPKVPKCDGGIDRTADGGDLSWEQAYPSSSSSS